MIKANPKQNIELSHIDISLIIAGLMELSEDPTWFSHICLVDVRENLKADSLRRLLDRMVEADLANANDWSPISNETLEKFIR